MVSFWSENRQFYTAVFSAIYQPNNETIAEFENFVKTYRVRLLNLFKLPPKNALDRQKVEASVRGDGIKFDVRDKPIVVPQNYVNEALIMSDVFDLNEILALQLIFAAQQETAVFPDFPRGLCAVYLYYKNQWYLCETLKTIMQNRSGLSWRYDDRPSELQNLLSAFTEQLWKDGFLANLLELISSLDVNKELDKLQQPNVKGVGNAKHRKLLSDTINQSYVSLVDSLFYWTCQTPFSVDEFASLMRIVRSFALTKDGQPTSPVNRTVVSVLMSALQAIDVTVLETVRAESELSSAAPSFLKDFRYLNAYHEEICNARWNDPHLEGLFLVFWSVSLRIIGQHHLTQLVFEKFTGDDDDELLDRGMQTNPMAFLRRLVTADGFYESEFFCRRIHSFVTQLIVYFPIKIKEWRSRADEIIREFSSSQMPPIHFEQFLYFLGDFYKNDRENLQLSSTYFYPLDTDVGTTTKFSPTQISLFKFVRESGEALPPLMYVAYLHMLNGMSSNEQSAGRCFFLLKSFANYGVHLSNVSLDHFFDALSRYYSTLRTEKLSTSSFPTSNVAVSLSHIAPDELKGLQAWLNLIATIAHQNGRTRLLFCDDNRWTCLSTMFGLLGCPVPLELKGLLFQCLGSFARSPELIQVLFDGLIASGVVSILPDGKLGGLQQELIEVETRNETYPATCGFLAFLSSLMSHKGSSNFDGIAFRPYFTYVVDSVFIQFQNRSYKNAEEMWNLGSFLAKCLHNVVDNFDVTLTNVTNQTPGCQLMTLLICDSPAFRTVVNLLDTGVTILDQYVSYPGKTKLEETTLFLLKLIGVVLDKQDLFLSYLRQIPTSILTSSMDVLLQTMNPRSREPDYPIKIACYLSYYEWLPEHCLQAVKILSKLHATSSSLATKLLKNFSSKLTVSVRILNGYVNCLGVDEVDAHVGRDFSADVVDSYETTIATTTLNVLEFLIKAVRTSSIGGEPNVAHFLLGFDTKKIAETTFQNPGINNTPKTCLHAILSILESFCGQNLNSLPYGAFVEPCYRLLYWLASDRNGGEPTLRYLRGQRDFVYRHVSKLRLDNDTTDDGRNLKPTETNLVRREIVGWLLKLMALELKSSTQLNHRSNINRILKFFFASGAQTDDMITDASSYSDLSKSSVFGVSAKQKNQSNKTAILSFLHYVVDCKLTSVAQPKLEYFEGSRLSQVISACTSETAKGYAQCDIVRLHEVLHSEAQTVQGTSFAGQLHLLHDEIEKILISVVQYNEAQRISYVRRLAFEGWRQLVEITFLTCSLDVFNVEQRVQTIAELLTDVLSFDLSGLSRSVVSVILTLTTALRYQFVSVVNSSDVDESLRERLLNFETSRYVSVLDGTYVRGSNFERIEELKHLTTISSAFRLFLEFMLKPENKRSPQTRALGYGSLMNLIRLAMPPIDLTDPVMTSVQYPSVRERMVEDHRNILNNYLVEIAELLAKDSFDGPDFCRVLARACLSTVLSNNPEMTNQITSTLAGRGYAEYQIVNLITEDDPVLRKFLTLDDNVEIR